MTTVEDRDAEVRLSELETGLSSNTKSVGKEVDNAMSKPSASSSSTLYMLFLSLVLLPTMKCASIKLFFCVVFICPSIHL